MPEYIRVSTVLPATPEQIYTAWMNSRQHTAMTGGAAKVTPRVGGKHTAWDGYIWGQTFELEPYRRIVQSWRSTEFPSGSEDSRLVIQLWEIKGGTRLTLFHSNIPNGQGEKYRGGWRESYFDPMLQYFSRRAPRRRK